MSLPEKSRSCPLCESSQLVQYHRDRRRVYLQCGKCRLVFVPREFFLTAAAEKAEYDLHRNDPSDSGYRRFLARLCQPMQKYLLAGAVGLDFGSGPGPTLSVMFAECGYPMDVYDCFYAKHPQVFLRTYDFVTATEVVEHLYKPAFELCRLWGGVKAGGYLGIMTKLVRSQAAFAGWHYIHDPTHVCFFSVDTWQWLASCWGAVIRYQEGDVIILEKPTHIVQHS